MGIGFSERRALDDVCTKKPAQSWSWPDDEAARTIVDSTCASRRPIASIFIKPEVVDAWSRTGSQAHASLPHEVVARQRTIRDLVERDRAGSARGRDAGAAPLQAREARARLGVAGRVHRLDLILTNTKYLFLGEGNADQTRERELVMYLSEAKNLGLNTSPRRTGSFSGQAAHCQERGQRNFGGRAASIASRWGFY